MNEADLIPLFRRLYLAELELGCLRSADAYARDFPGFEEMIREQYQRMTLDGEGAVEASGRGRGSGVERIGRYRLQQEVGRGGQAVVWRAHDEELKRDVAVKILTRSAMASERTLRRFRREAEVCSRLNHPGICAVFEAGMSDGIAFIAMQFVEGQTLASVIQDSAAPADDGSDLHFDAAGGDVAGARAPASVPDKDETARRVRLIERAARALHVAHEAGIVHRDIKPGNVIIAADDQPVILDFGLAHHDDDSHVTLTHTGEFFGTPAYMSPEQISAHRIDLDRRTDVFSLGVTLYECLTGVRPFDAGSHAATYQAIMVKEAKDPRRINRAVSAELSAVAQKAMEKDRDRRYATASDFADDLAAALALKPVKARRTGPLVRAMRFAQRNRAVAVLLALLACVSLGSAAWFSIDALQRRRDAVEERDESRRTVERLFGELRSDVFETFKRPGAASDLVNAVKALGDEGREWIVERSRSDDSGDRVLAMQVMASLSDPATIPRLKEASIEDNESIASLASHALIRMESAEIVPPLLDVLASSPHEAARLNSIWGLCKFGNAAGLEAAEGLVASMDNPGQYDDAVLWSLLLLREPKLVPINDRYVDRLLAKPGKRSTQEVSNALVLAVRYYQTLGGEHGRARLELLAAHPTCPKVVRSEAEDALGRKRSEPRAPAD